MRGSSWRARLPYASGPALGGILVGWIGAGPAFGFAAALSAIAVVLLAGIYEPARQPATRHHPLQEIREGASFVLHHALLRPVFVTQFIFNTGSFLLLAVFVPYAVRRLALSATGVGTTPRAEDFSLRARVEQTEARNTSFGTPRSAVSNHSITVGLGPDQG